MAHDGVVSLTDTVVASAAYVAQVVAVVAGVAVGILLGQSSRRVLAAAATAVAGVALIAYVTIDGLGYTNANAALAVQASALAAIVLRRGGASRSMTVVVLLPALVMCWLESAWLAGLTWLVVVVAAIASPRSARGVRVAALIGWATVMVLPLLEVALVVSGWRPAVLVRPLSEARLILWSDALELIQQRPLLGHGPGSFAELNSIRDLSPLLTRAHSVFLGVAAEVGIGGPLALVLIITVGFVLLARAPSRESMVAVVAWTGLWVHAMLDFVADYPPVLLIAGLVVGIAASSAARHGRAAALARYSVG